MAATRALIRARHQAAAPRRVADIEPAGRSADRRGLRRHAGDLGSQPRRIRSGAALHRRDHVRRAAHDRRHLPGAARRLPGSRERRAVHAAARPDRLGHPRASPGLEGDRQSVRRRRSDRAVAGDPARRRAVPRADGRSRRQCLDRPRARARHHGARGEARPSSRSRRSTTAICSTIRCWLPARSPASTSRPSRSRPTALAARLPDHYPPDPAHLAEYARMAATAEGFAAYLERHVHAQRAA